MIVHKHSLLHLVLAVFLLNCSKNESAKKDESSKTEDQDEPSKKKKKASDHESDDDEESSKKKKKKASDHESDDDEESSSKKKKKKSTPTEENDDGVTFTARSPAIGQIFQVTKDVEMKLLMKDPSGKKETNVFNELHEEKYEEVLAVENQKITKQKITFKRAEEVERQETKERKKAVPYAGKSYIVELKKDQWMITDLKGNKPPKDEMDKLQKEYKTQTMHNPFADMLDKKSVKVGVSADALNKSLYRALGTEEKEVVESSAMLKTIESQTGQKVGIFDIAVTMSSKINEDAIVVSAKTKGSLAIRVQDGLISEMTLAGPIELVPNKLNATPVATGTMKIHATRALQVKEKE